MFGLNETEVQTGYDRAIEQPFDEARDLSPGFFDGSLTAVGHGFKDASAKILQVAASEPTQTERMAAPMTYAPRLFLSRVLRDTFGDRENFQDVIKANRPSPQTTGWLGQQAFALTSFLGRAIGGTVVTGSPVGGAVVVGVTEGYDTKEGLMTEGVDESTARKAGAVTGVTSGLGALVPAAVPGKLLTRVGSGAAINVAMGGTQRGLTSKILDDGGYKDMAEQYRVLDSAAITTDVILGGAFGAISKGAARPRPSDVDAALAANNWHQFEVESAPGVPINSATRNAHTEAMDLAATQLATGERVNVDLGDAEFLPKQVDKKVAAEVQKLVEETYNPASESSLAESGTPSISTSVGDSPLAQDLPVQRSAINEPSGPFAKRAMTPSESRTGDVSNAFIENSSTPVYHTVKDLQEITRTVQEIKPELDRTLQGISSKVDGLTFYGSRIKEDSSLAIKAVRRKVQGISDYLGGRLVADTPKAIEDAVNMLREDYQVMKVDNFLTGKPGGYRAVHVQVMSDKGVSAEIQIQPKEIRAVQDKNHEVYKKWQEVEAKHGGIPADMIEARAKELDGARKSFDAAWKKWEKRNGETDSGSKPTAEAKVVERSPDMKVVNDAGEVVTAKEALERVSAEEAQAKQEASVFQAAVQCFLEVGDA